jgi:hypothetical protein
MAVIISDNRNPAYDGNLSTSNGWWRVEAHNLAGFNSTSLSLSATRTINLTFANAGNLRGIVIGLIAATKLSFMRETVTLTLKNAGTVIATTSLNKSSIIGLADTDVNNNNCFTPRFEFNIPVLTTAGIYTVEITNSGAGTTNWSLPTSNGTVPFYLAWCDNQVTASSTNDCLCIQDPIVVNSNFTTKCNGLGTGDASNGASVVLLTGSNGAVANVANLRWINPAAPYTLTIDGILVFSCHSGIRMGTSSTPIPAAQQATISFTATPSFGSVRGTRSLRFSNSNCGGGSVFIHGEVPTQRMLRLAQNANIGQANIVLTEAPTTWQIGDTIYLYKRDTNTLNYTTYTITNISGSTVTLNTNITGNNFISGSPVINFARHGCQLISQSTTNVSLAIEVPYNLTMAGLYCEYISFGFRGAQSRQNQVTVGPNTSDYLIQDLTHRTIGNLNVLGSFDVPGVNILINRMYCMAQLMMTAPSFTPTNDFLGGYKRSGIFSITNCIFQGSQSGSTSFVFSGPLSVFSGNEIYGSQGNLASDQYGVILTNFIEGTFTNNKFWRTNGTVNLNGVFVPKNWSNNIFDGVQVCYAAFNSSIGVIIKNDFYGQELANTNEVLLNADVYQDIQIQDSLGTVKVSTVLQQLLVDNTNGALRIVNDNQIANVDRVWNKNGFIQRTGTGLGDTTKKVGLYAIRFESNNNTNPLIWPKNQPTGNIQGKSMTVGIWINIASANYWSAGHTMPRLTVIYDNGSTVYGEATQTAGAWQWVQASFTPTTNFGQITVILSTQTVATGSNAYVYFADFSGPLPQGTQLNLGEFNLWADAFPVAPLSFSTLINANDVWSANLTNFGNNTAGKKLQNSSTVSEVGQLLTNILNN